MATPEKNISKSAEEIKNSLWKVLVVIMQVFSFKGVT